MFRSAQASKVNWRVHTDVVTLVGTDVMTSTEVMMQVLKLRKYGNSTGTTFPKETLSRLRVKEGDDVYLVETSRGFDVTPYNPEFAEQMDVAE